MTIPALGHVIARLTRSVPQEILRVAFDDGGRGASVSIDAHIKREIIEAHVLPELNATCGKPKQIPLLGGYLVPTTDARRTFSGAMMVGSIFQIPANEREDRPIVEVRGLSFGFAYSQQAGQVSPLSMAGQGDSMASLARAVLSSHTLADGNITPRAILRSGNLIQVVPNMMAEGILCNCVLGYDAEFTNIPGGMLDPLTRYVIAVTKGYIYNKLTIQIDQGQLLGGAMLGRFKEIVDRYEQEGSDEVQATLLDNFRGGSILDPDNFRRYLRLAL